MSDLFVNPQPPLPNPSVTGPDAAFLAALIVALNATFLEYGQRVNAHERGLDAAAAENWMVS